MEEGKLRMTVESGLLSLAHRRANGGVAPRIRHPCNRDPIASIPIDAADNLDRTGASCRNMGLLGHGRMKTLDPRIVDSLRSAYDRRTSRGELLSTDRLQSSYAAFRARFGPDALKSLDGPALLFAM